MTIPIRSADDPIEVSWFNDIRDNLSAVSDIESSSTTITLDNDNHLVFCDGTLTLNLPAVADTTIGKVFIIKNIGTGSITIDANGTETIDGALTAVIDIQYSSLTLANDGVSAWYVIA